MRNDQASPRVFISYSHDSQDYKDWIRSFADRLIVQGVMVTLDQYDLALGEMTPQFMEKGISENDYVLLFISKRYIEKATIRKGGVGFEIDLASGEIIVSQNRRKFIPILVQVDFSEMPPILKGANGIKIDNLFSYERQFDELYATITGQKPQKPMLGPIRKMASTLQTEDPFDVEKLGLAKNLNKYCYWDVEFLFPALKDNSIAELYSSLRKHTKKAKYWTYTSVEPHILETQNIKKNSPEIVFESRDYYANYTNMISYERLTLMANRCRYSFIEYTSNLPYYFTPNLGSDTLLHLLPMIEKVHTDFGQAPTIDCIIRIKSNVDAIFNVSSNVLPTALRIGEDYIHKEGLTEEKFRMQSVDSAAAERFFNRILESFVSTRQGTDEPFLRVVHEDFLSIYKKVCSTIQ